MKDQGHCFSVGEKASQDWSSEDKIGFYDAENNVFYQIKDPCQLSTLMALLRGYENSDISTETP